MSRGYGSSTAAILAALQEYGPLTRAEVCEVTGLDHDFASAVLSRLNRVGKTTPKRVYIRSYVHDALGERRYPRAIYELGDKPDAKRPKSDKRAIRKRYDDNRRRRLAGASVFTWGLRHSKADTLAKQVARASK